MTKYSHIKAIDNGARFYDVDLHIHTYGGSSDVSDISMTAENIIDSAVRQGLGVIAITDHNSNASIEDALDHAQNYLGDLLVLPGVEVTTSHGHLLVYFAPDQSASLEKYLSSLELVGDRGEQNTRTKKSMADAIELAESLGGICVAAHIDRGKTGFEGFASGFQNWKRDIVMSPGLYGLECDSTDALRWYSDHDNHDPTGAERAKLLTARRAVTALVARPHLAHLQGSDSHSLKAFEHQNPTKPWTRIKLNELSFEAFRTAMVDPRARVRARASIPKSFPRIRGIAFTGGFLNGELIHFSDNLNSLVGGRGTGKSTVVRSLAYALGELDDFGDYGHCPDSVTVWCEDENGILYAYKRSRDGELNVWAKEDASVSDVPSDSFRVEYYGQGELADVAKDPLETPELFQNFLDRHTNLDDLVHEEREIVTRLKENAAKLEPLEVAFSQLRETRRALKDVEKKLKIAEEGKLKEIAAAKTKLASEKSIREAIDAIASDYKEGLSLSSFRRDYDHILDTVGQCTDDEESKQVLEDIKSAIAESNTSLKNSEAEINSFLAVRSEDLTKLTSQLKQVHARLDEILAEKIADLQKKGLSSGSLMELERLLKRKESLTNQINKVERNRDQLRDYRKQRKSLLKELGSTRYKMTARRKAQLRTINSNLSSTIKDYLIFVKYDASGIIDDFVAFLEEEMRGTYLPDEIIEQICRRVTPPDLAGWIRTEDSASISKNAKISSKWSDKLIEIMSPFRVIFALEILAKQPKPVIVVKTRSAPVEKIPVSHLSDGQRHTILLTIAMLAESNIPLIIDQPEDDLDNEFIFESVVETLRSIKERRQVILVTHNANIAVLGDSEQLLPMERESNRGKIKERGSIDRQATKQQAQRILEGGPDAFLRRKEIYGH